MRGKRSKQYRKLMEQYCMTFGFREPYQVLVDAEMVHDACRFKMDLAAGLERTVHGKAKPMITQCEIRKLYAKAKNNEHGASEAIDVAKNYERRRCGHHPDQYPEPLSTLECLNSVVDPKQSGQNKHRYVVASQSQEVRRMLRGVRAVPLIYIKRSVMILEPMADDSANVRMKEEKAKFRAEIRSNLGKRKRTEGGEDNDSEDGRDKESKRATTGDGEEKKKKKKYGGQKEPNPLSVKKSKKTNQAEKAAKPAQKPESTAEETAAEPAKRKRRNRGKGGKGKKEGGEDAGETAGGENDDE